MKRIILLLILFCSVKVSFSQSVLYFNFVTHNEETNQWNNPTFYMNNRINLINLATYFQTNGITWNFQSDHVFLTNVISQETPAVTATTNNKNILRYLFEDKGVEIDPHGHETIYIYPDLAHLMDSIGLPESKIIGGTIYDSENGINVWTDMSNGQYGVVFPWAFWQPDYLWGAGTPNHVNDPKYFGVWNPQDTNNFLTNDTTQHIRYLATGCEIKIQDTSQVIYIVNQLKEVAQNVQSGSYPANGFYMQTIFFEHAELNTAGFYNKVIEVADSVTVLVNAGMGQWKTLKQMYTEWETTYGAQMFMWECGDIVGIDETQSQTNIKVFPNPTSDKLKIELNVLVFQLSTEIEIYNVLGELVYERILLDPVSEIDVGIFSDGVYFFYVRNNQNNILKGKFIKQ